MVKRFPLFPVALLSLLAAGCSGAADEGTKPAATKQEATPTPAEPVVLKMYQYASNITDEAFKAFIADPVNKKYPNITIQLIRNTAEVTPQSLIASGNFPDLVYTGVNNTGTFLDLKVPIDFSQLAKKYNFDLSKFGSTPIAAVQNYGKNGELYALPFFDRFAVLIYNKDIFDKFAVPYPKDGMTWEELTDLAKKVTRTADGVAYKGLYSGGIRNLGASLSLAYVDQKTNKSALTTDGWKRVFETAKAIDDIPGNTISNFTNSFYKDNNLAMIAVTTERLAEVIELTNQGSKLNWDIAAYPNFKENPGIGLDSNPTIMMISTFSKHPDQAFQVLATVTDAENQTNMMRNGTFSVLRDPKIKEVYGADLPALKGKNVKGMLRNDFAKPAPFSEFDTAARTNLNKAYTSVTSGQVDINTALRTADDATNLAIAEKK